ncbi:MAG: anthranilate synthase component I [bacterium]
MYHPSFADFKGLSKKRKIIPVYKEILGDLETPVSCFCKVRGEYSYLLESAESEERIGRYSIIGVNPRVFFKIEEDRVEIIKEGAQGARNKEQVTEENPLLFLKEIIEEYGVVPIEGLPRFFGGAVGFVGYDYIRFIENLPSRKRDSLKIPTAFFVITENNVIFDHFNHTIKITASIPIEKSPDETYDTAIGSIERIEEKLKNPLILPCEKIKSYKEEFETSKEDYVKMVKRAKEYIKAGDIFQVVLSQRIKRKTSASPVSIYRALRHINPSPYMFLLDFSDLKIIGSSPELLVRLEDGIAETRPLAGTRRRGKTDEEDKKLEEELLDDPKERAEHIMLVDLGRNDLGRVCDFGSVCVSSFMNVEKYSHVMHIVSSVKGKVKKGLSGFELLSASFPAGTLTGAPKIRAGEIIDELEPKRRGIYGGCVGYFGFSGNMDTAITIRTILLYKGIAYIQAGAGIVSDSDPEREYEESLNKAGCCLSAISLAEEGFIL